jgi:MSHA pilin protein MshC
MSLMNKNELNKASAQNGFTLIELIVVIILISIMSVTVLPKFFTSNGFEEFTYRDELITKLRAIQLRSMQQTNDSTCLNIQIETNPSVLGLQATNTDPTITGVCRMGFSGDTTTVRVDSKHSVFFTLSEGLTSFSFSSLGKPVSCTPINICGITITVNGENSPQILINSEGYIHAI